MAGLQKEEVKKRHTDVKVDSTHGNGEAHSAQKTALISIGNGL